MSSSSVQERDRPETRPTNEFQESGEAKGVSPSPFALSDPQTCRNCRHFPHSRRLFARFPSPRWGIIGGRIDLTIESTSTTFAFRTRHDFCLALRLLSQT